jgi:hypothetical protein
MGNIAMTHLSIMLNHILGERRPMTATSFFSLTSKVKYFFKFLMIITSVRRGGTTWNNPGPNHQTILMVSSPLET